MTRHSTEGGLAIPARSRQHPEPSCQPSPPASPASQRCCSPPQPTPAACRRHATSPTRARCGSPWTPPTSSTGCSACTRRARAPGPLAPAVPEVAARHSRAHRPDRGAGRPRDLRRLRAPRVQRDPLDVYAFRVAVPRGITRLEIGFKFASAATSAGRHVITPDLLVLQWDKPWSIPAGHFARRIPRGALVTLPAGWSRATALEATAGAGNDLSFAPVTLEQLVDRHCSPAATPTPAAGRGRSRSRIPQPLRRPALTAGDQPEQLAAHRRCCAKPCRVRVAALRPLRFPARGQRPGQRHRPRTPAVERKRLTAGYFTDWDSDRDERDLLAHELVHSWNGKSRRPADLWAPTYNVPMQDSLLWVYEGMTEFWGDGWRRVPACGARRSRATRWRMPPRRSSTRALAGAGVRCRTRPTSPSSSIARRCPIRAGSATRTITPRACCSGSTSTRACGS